MRRAEDPTRRIAAIILLFLGGSVVLLRGAEGELEIFRAHDRSAKINPGLSAYTTSSIRSGRMRRRYAWQVLIQINRVSVKLERATENGKREHK